MYQNSIQQEIKSRLKSGNTCYHSVRNPLSFENLKTMICRYIILPVVLYGCETWSLKLREESRLRVSENRVLRRIFGPKIRNEELNVLYCSSNIVRVIKIENNELGRACSTYGEGKVLQIWWAT